MTVSEKREVPTLLDLATNKVVEILTCTPHNAHDTVYRSTIKIQDITKTQDNAYLLPENIQTKLCTLIANTSHEDLSCLRFLKHNEVKSCSIEDLRTHTKAEAIIKSIFTYLPKLTSFCAVNSAKECFDLLTSTYAIKTLDLSCSESITDKDLESILQKFPFVESLFLNMLSITTIPDIKLQNLEHLTLHKCSQIAPKSFSKLSIFAPRLKKLDVSHTQFESLEHLKNLPLEELNIHFCLNISQDSFTQLSSILPTLKVLNASTTKIYSVEGFPPLKTLVLHSTNIDPQSFHLIPRIMPMLETFMYTPVNKYDIPLQWLSDLKELRYLDLSCCTTIDASEFKYIEHIAPNLISLKASFTHFSYQSEYTFDNLEYLEIDFCPELTEKDKHRIIKNSPKLQNLVVGNIDKEISTAIANKEQFKNLQLAVQGSLEDLLTHIDTIEILTPVVSYITHLSLENSCILTFENLHFPKLLTLSVLFCEAFLLEGLQKLCILAPELRKLSLENVSIDTFSNCTFHNVQFLKISWCDNLNNEAMKTLQSAFPNVKMVELESLHITDLSWCSIPSLNHVVIKNCSGITSTNFNSCKRLYPTIEFVITQDDVGSDLEVEVYPISSRSTDQDAIDEYMNIDSDSDADSSEIQKVDMRNNTLYILDDDSDNSQSDDTNR